MVRPSTFFFWAWMGFLACGLGWARGPAKDPSAKGSAALPEGEPELGNEDLKKMSETEIQALNRADKVFAQKDYRRSVAEYEAFLLEFGKSAGVPYALFRKGRSIHLDQKRNEAIKIYREVIEYFREEKTWAGSAWYFLGQAQWDNGDTEKALLSWADMVADPAHRSHPLAAWALLRLAAEARKNNQPDKAAGYFQQVALDFRKTNPQASQQGIAQAALLLILALDEPRFRAFYEAAKTFGREPGLPGSDPATDRPYWETLRGWIQKGGKALQEKGTATESFFRYWTQVMRGKFPDWDEFQIEWANWVLLYEKDQKKWAERMDAQFLRGFKPGDWARILHWMKIFAGEPQKIKEYYARLAFAQMKNAQIEAAMRLFYQELNDPTLGRNIFAHLRLNEYSDQERAALATFFFPLDGEAVLKICGMFQNKEAGRFTLLNYYVSRKEVEPALELAEELSKSAEFAKPALRLKAGLLESIEEYQKAIATWWKVDDPPASLYAIAACHQKLGEVDKAIKILREVEDFFPGQNSLAAMKVAQVYEEARMSGRYFAQLKYIMKKYPKSKESNVAHLALEKAGQKIAGGVDEE